MRHKHRHQNDAGCGGNNCLLSTPQNDPRWLPVGMTSDRTRDCQAVLFPFPGLNLTGERRREEMSHGPIMLNFWRDGLSSVAVNWTVDGSVEDEASEFIG